MKRQDFLNKLKLCKPALASKNIVESFTHFCFDGSYVMAYNDLIGIRTKCDEPIEGAVHGATLEGLLSNSGAKDVTFDQGENTIRMKAGQSKTDLPYLPSDDFLFEFPELGDTIPLEITDDWLEGLKRCLVTASNDTSTPEYMGVTVKAMSEIPVLYSTDNQTISKYMVEHPGDGLEDTDGVHFILSTHFVDNLLDLIKKMGRPDVTLFLGEDFVVAQVGSQCEIFGRLIDSSPASYEDVIQRLLANDDERVEVPRTLPKALKRSVVLYNVDEKAQCQIAVDGDKLRISTQSSFGNSKDPLKLGENDHSDREININPQLVSRVLDYVEYFSILDGALVVGDNQYTCFIAPKG